MEMNESLEREENPAGVKFFVVVIILLFVLYFLKQYDISRNRVYVLGRYIRSVDAGSETGWLNHFTYMYDSIEYSTSFGSPLGKFYKLDSLMFIVISSKRPGLCESLEDYRVMKCISMKTQPRLGWKSIPVCPLQ
jgi:hypothetical protein